MDSELRLHMLILGRSAQKAKMFDISATCWAYLAQQSPDTVSIRTEDFRGEYPGKSYYDVAEVWAEDKEILLVQTFRIPVPLLRGDFVAEIFKKKIASWSPYTGLPGIWDINERPSRDQEFAEETLSSQLLPTEELEEVASRLFREAGGPHEWARALTVLADPPGEIPGILKDGVWT